MIRKALPKDIDAIERIYDAIHAAEERGTGCTGWIRGVYPTVKTAEEAMKRGDLFVLDEKGAVLGAGIINQLQVDVYRGAPWRFPAEDSQVCVLHTLVIAPDLHGKGLGRRFVSGYEAYAANHHWLELRLDTNARNLPARSLYRKLGYEEIGIVPTAFNGIPDVQLVLLEKHLN